MLSYRQLRSIRSTAHHLWRKTGAIVPKPKGPRVYIITLPRLICIFVTVHLSQCIFAMSIIHTVLVKVKADAAIKSPDLVTIIEGTLKAIPHIRRYKVGEAINAPEKHKGYNIAFILEFADQQDLNKYVDHELHKALATKSLGPNIDDIIIHDLQF